MKWRETRCKSCRAWVIWAETDNGKRMPVDATPSPEGSFRLVAVDPRAAVPVARFVGELFRKPEELLHTSHFATCPQADQHRGPR